jgi:hypothetical protein
VSYKEQLVEALKNGLLLLVKYGLLIVAIVYAFSFSIQTRDMAVNGNQAAIAIVELQKKGWFPVFKDGTVPNKDGSSNSQTQ